MPAKQALLELVLLLAAGRDRSVKGRVKEVIGAIRCYRTIRRNEVSQSQSTLWMHTYRESQGIVGLPRKRLHRDSFEELKQHLGW